MKKSLFKLLLICSLLYSLPVFGQYFNMVGIDLGLGYSSYSSNKSNTTGDFSSYVSISPQFGMYLSNSLVGGIGVSYSKSKAKSQDWFITKEEQSSILVSPFIKYYSKPGFYLMAEFNNAWVKSYVSLNSNLVHPMIWPLEQRTNAISMGFSAFLGYAISAGKRFKIEPSIEYYYKKYDYEDTDYTSKTNGISFHIGFTYNY
jgi:hypothetical protein